MACLLSAADCVDREQQAKRLLDDALAAWQSDKFEVAEESFECVRQYYLATAVASEAHSARQLLIEKYKADNDPALMTLNNRGFFSSQVIHEIGRYYQINGVYPATLTVIDFPQREAHLWYLSLCDYQPTFFEYGFRLNCQAADIEFAKTYPNIAYHHDHHP